MKAIVLAQLNPTKTMQQIIADRRLFRIMALTSLVVANCL
jgi:hypothetical protein